jgi:hypothetical protein
VCHVAAISACQPALITAEDSQMPGDVSECATMRRDTEPGSKSKTGKGRLDGDSSAPNRRSCNFGGGAPTAVSDRDTVGLRPAVAAPPFREDAATQVAGNSMSEPEVSCLCACSQLSAVCNSHLGNSRCAWGDGSQDDVTGLCSANGSTHTGKRSSSKAEGSSAGWQGDDNDGQARLRLQGLARRELSDVNGWPSG